VGAMPKEKESGAPTVVAQYTVVHVSAPEEEALQASAGPVFFSVTVRNVQSGALWTISRRYNAFEALARKLESEKWWRAIQRELPPKWPAPGRNMSQLQKRAVLLQAWALAVLGEPKAVAMHDTVVFFELDPPQEASKLLVFKVQEVQGALGGWFRCAICAGARQQTSLKD